MIQYIHPSIHLRYQFHAIPSLLHLILISRPRPPQSSSINLHSRKKEARTNISHPPPAVQSLLPDDIPVHHLGLFRERSTLQPVEYYNNLPFHRPDTFSKTDTTSAPNELAAHTAILVDPIIATGGTADAAIQLLREWGVKRILYLSVLGSEGGVRRAAQEWPEGVQVWVGAVDQACDERGMIVPGLGDIGDRLFKAVGK